MLLHKIAAVDPEFPLPLLRALAGEDAGAELFDAGGSSSPASQSARTGRSPW